MENKLLRKLPSLLVCVLLIGTLTGCWYTNTRGKEAQVDEMAAAYIAEQYPGNDFEVSPAAYSFMDSCYYVHIQSRSSPDTNFKLRFDSFSLELTYDSYETSVSGGWNTRARLLEEYDALIQETLGSMEELVSCSADFCQYSENESDLTLYFSPNGLDGSTLIPDKDYDVGALGWEYGYLEVTFLETKENLHMERILELLREIDKRLTEANVGYYTLYIKVATGTFPDSYDSFYVFGITKDVLSSPDPLARLQTLWDAQEANRQAIRDRRENNDS